MVDETPQFGTVPPAAVLGQYRDEGGREGTLGKQTAKEIRDLEGDEKGVGEGIGTEDLRIDQVTGKPEDPGQQREAANGGQRLEERQNRDLRKAAIIRAIGRRRA